MGRIFTLYFHFMHSVQRMHKNALRFQLFDATIWLIETLTPARFK